MLEKWKDIKDYEKYYQVSDKGRIKSLSRKVKMLKGRSYNSKEIIMKQKDIRGYKNVTLNAEGVKQTFQVHRLVLTHFKPKEDMEELQVNHLDCDKSNNDIDNLEWCTPSENMRHASENRRLAKQYGENNPMSKLNNEAVLEIVELSSKGISNLEISKIYNVNRKSIWNVLNGKAWSHITNIKKCND